jgi:uncharacterized protein YodC (DUF2158 family)
MPERKFQDGDEVQLKSGGSIMTIESWDETRKRYCCVWFEKSKVLRDYFIEATLAKYVPGTPFAISSLG